MVTMRVYKNMKTFHGPCPAPVRIFVAYATKLCRGRFMAPMRDHWGVKAPPEPERGCVRSTNRRACARSAALRLGLRPQPRSVRRPVAGLTEPAGPPTIFRNGKGQPW